MTRRIHTAGNARSWRFDSRPMHASDRLHTHGKVLPMERERGFLARLLRWRG